MSSSKNAIITEQDRQFFYNSCRNDPVYFVEHMLHDETGDPYILEEYQKQFMRCPARNRILFYGRRMSKSLMMKWEILHRSIFTRAHKGLIVSPSWDQSIQFGEDINDLINATPTIQPFFDGLKQTKLKLKNNSRIYLVSAGNKGISSLGKGVHLLAFDEAQQIPEEAYTFLRPTLLGQKKSIPPSLIYAGTPLGRIGTFYNAIQDGKYFLKMDGIYDNPNVESRGEMDYVIFERPTAILDDEGKIVASGTDRISLAELEEELLHFPRTIFLREYCLQFLDQIGEVFSQELINDVVDRNAGIQYRSDKKLVMGLDLGKQRYNSVLTIAEVQGHGRCNIIYVHDWELGTDYHDIAADVFNMKERYPNTMELRVDETGVGKGVIEIFEHLFRTWNTVAVEGFDFAGPKKKQMLVEAGVLDLERGMVKMVFNNRMINEMLEFKREITDKNNIIYRKPDGGTDDYVDSLLLTLLAVREYYDYEEGNVDVIQTGQKILAESYNRLRRMVV
jgi:hypothetical protein